MKIILRIYLLGLIAVLFVSTTGVTIYEHYCSQKIIEQSFFKGFDDSCNMHQMKETNAQHDCCQESENDEMHDDCCSQSTRYYQINSDLINHDFSIEVTKIVSSTSFINLSLANKTEEVIKPIVPNPPPKLTTLQRLSLFQTYLI